MITRIKICGITQAEDAIYAEQLGVDAIGLVFHKKSPRSVEVEQVADILHGLGGLMTCIGLFYNAKESFVWSVLNQFPQIVPQFHGVETAQFCEQFERPYLKALAMGAGNSALTSLAEYSHATGILLDANKPGQMGGTGDVFDWGLIPEVLAKPLILAGGLNPQNITEAIRRVRPYAVDVSSGVESTRGVKDHQLMYEFVNRARGADSEDF